MRPRMLLAVDVVLILTATLIALALRENFDISEARFQAFLPYLAATAFTALILVPVAGIHKAIWRFSGLPDYLRAACVVTGVSAGAVALSFAYNRLDGVARSLPFLQGIVGILVLIGVRVFHRVVHSVRERRKASAALLRVPVLERETHVLIVGLNRLTEIYIQALAEFDRGRIGIAGLVGRTGRQVGRNAANYPVLGVPEEIESILDSLEICGTSVERIVVAVPFDDLAQEAQDALLRVERSRSITLQFLTEFLAAGGADDERKRKGRSGPPTSAAHPSFEIEAAELQSLSERQFWKVKRGFDALAALCLLVVSTPVFALVAIFVAASVGFPVVFWQRRPGLGGRSFRLYKFRTMRAAHDANGGRIPDAQRISRLGTILRRLRLDELPQLFNILLGDMSFVGPRPLLLRDQPQDCAARLMVRPGLSGWAQVVGGREISPEDKAALDVWYVRNASLFLDLKIAVRTIPMVLIGERISLPLIEEAWRDLTACGVVKAQLMH
ncbi:MAG: sugar transferase [Rhodomicrobium sp.]